MAITLASLYQPVQAHLDGVQAATGQIWQEALEIVHGPFISPPKAGGKLLRPALCLLSAGAAGAAGAEDVSEFVSLAVAVEMLHMAALTHDDVVDNADTRRGSASLNALWDDRTAVLSGDYLVARSVNLMAEYGSCDVIAATFEAIRRMTEGELANLGPGTEGYTQEDCLRIADQKTASYFATTCSLPTFLLGETYRKALRAYGHAVGVAFQLVDDLLDIAQDEATLGKPSCGDIVGAKKTLPILFMREALDAADRDRFKKMAGHPIAEKDRHWVAAILESTGARARTEAIAREYADKARAALDFLPATPYRDSMLGLAEFVLVRGS